MRKNSLGGLHDKKKRRIMVNKGKHFYWTFKIKTLDIIFLFINISKQYHSKHFYHINKIIKLKFWGFSASKTVNLKEVKIRRD